MAKSSKSLIIFSDIHVGSKSSICSESPEITDGENYPPTKGQKDLLQCWKHCCDDITQKPNAIVVNGEPVDGINKRSMGAGQWTTNFVDETRDFKKLFELIPRTPKTNVFFVRGSGYHVTADGATPIEELVAEGLNADKYRAYGGSGYTDYELNVKMNDKHFNFTHHVGFSRWFQYRTTPIASEMAKMHFEHTKRGFHTDVMVRSHVHYYVEVRFPNTIGFTTPAWKFPDGFMYRTGEPTLPDVGCIEVIVESNGKIIVEPHLTEVNFKPMVMDV